MKMVLLPVVLALGIASSTPARTQSSCGTVVPPGPVLDTVWTLAGSPYCVTGDIEIGPLTIEAGVEVRIDGLFGIEVVAPIVAEGTCSQPVLIRGTTPSSSPRWNGLRFQGIGPGSVFRHVIVSEAVAGAITLIDSAAPVLEDCVFSDNSPGGALLADGMAGDLTLMRCSFSGNRAAFGGAVSASFVPGSGGRLVTIDCSFTGNISQGATGEPALGGAIHLVGDATITDCTFRSNRADGVVAPFFSPQAWGAGGALYLDGPGETSVEGSLFLGNVANGGHDSLFCLGAGLGTGGALYVRSGTVRASSTLFSGNRTTTSEGGVGGCAVSSEYGSAIYVENLATELALDHCTVVGSDHRVGPSSVIEGNGTAIRIASSIVHNPLLDPDRQIVGSDVVVNWSCVLGGQPGTGNIDADPLFIGTGIESEELQLSSASPCLDAADPDPLQDDGCIPPAGGGLRGDMGGFGGPGNCAWTCPVVARTTSRSGTGTSNGALISRSLPAVGRCWTTELNCSFNSSAGMAYLQVKRFPSSGTFVFGKEILIAGPQFVYLSKPHARDRVYFNGRVPASPSLCGFTVSAQGACFGDGFLLSNALDLTLGR